jgi:hypothetical protein
MTYSSLPGLSSGEDYEWSKANHELNELVSQARWHMLGNLERINQVCRFANLRCRGLRDVETTAIHTLPPGQADSVSRVFQPQCAHSFSSKLGRKCSAPDPTSMADSTSGNTSRMADTTFAAFWSAYEWNNSMTTGL